MSHNTTAQCNITNLGLAKRIVEGAGGKMSIHKKAKTVSLYGSNRATAVATITLPDWRYPIAVTEEGNVVYDHFGSRPGSMEKFHDILQQYNEEMIVEAIVQHQANGCNMSWSSDKADDGAIELVISYH